MSIAAYLAVARAPFLLLPVALVAVGAGAAAYGGGFEALRTLWALVGLVALHVAVDAWNEVSDYRRGIDLLTRRTPFSGGSGTLPAARLSPRAATVLAAGGALVGLAVGLGFLSVVGWKLVPILVLGAVAVLGYTDLLARRYLGELSAGLGLGALPVLGTALVQAGELAPAAWAAAAPAFLMTFNLLLLNEFPDEEADRRGGRRNLLTLLGRRVAAWIYAAAALMVPAAIAAAVAIGVFPRWSLLAILPSLLLAAPLGWAFARPQAEVPAPALGANVAWNLVTNAVLAGSLFFAV